MRIFAITIGDTNAASTHYRILQYLPMLAQAGMQITVVARECLTLKHLQAMAQADVVINQKTQYYMDLISVVLNKTKRYSIQTLGRSW